MRTLKELLIILRDNAKVRKTLFGPRICSDLRREARVLAFEEVILHYEADKLDDFIRQEEKKGEYYYNKNYLFKPGLWRCRKRWLNKQINNL